MFLVCLFFTFFKSKSCFKLTTHRRDCNFVLIYSQSQMVNNTCLKFSTEKAVKSYSSAFQDYGKAQKLCSQLDTDYSKVMGLRKD